MGKLKHFICEDAKPLSQTFATSKSFDVHRAVHPNIISIVKPTRCTSVSNVFILEWHSTCFGRSFRPSSWVQDCAYSNRHLSNRYCCLLASKQTAVSVCHMPLLCVQWKTPDDGQRNCPKHVEFYSKNKFEKFVHLVGFIIRIYHDARSHESETRCKPSWN